MAWVPEPISLDELDPKLASVATASISVTGYGRGFRPNASVTLSHENGSTLAVTHLDIRSPNEFRCSLSWDQATVTLGPYAATMTNEPADGTTPADNTTTLAHAFVVEP